MGWWSIGEGEIMGDHPADVVGELFREMRQIAERGGAPGVTLEDLAAAFTDIIDGKPGLLSGRKIAKATAGRRFREALRELLVRDGFTFVEVPKAGSLNLLGAVYSALGQISRSYQDTERGRKPTLREVIEAFTFVLRPCPEKYLALIRPLAEAAPHHPLLGAAGATAADLLARCSPEAAATLALAGRIARLRVQAPLGPGGAGPAVGPLDLLRALQVSGELTALLEGTRLTGDFAAHTAALRSLMTVAPAAEPALELDPRWRPWLTALLATRPGTLDSAGLLGALSTEALDQLVGYDEVYLEGLCTPHEIVGRLAERQEELTGWGAARVFFGAHVDRGGELEALASGLRSANAAVVVADQVPLALCLAQAWAASTGALARMPLRPSSSGSEFWAPHDRLERWGVTAPGGQSGVVLTLSASRERRALRGLLESDPEEVAAQMRALADGDVMIVVMSEQALGAARAAAPSLDAFPTVKLPPLEDWDLLAAWLCQRPRAALASGDAFTLLDLVEALEAADEEVRFTLDWDELRPFRDVPARRRRSSLRRALQRWQRKRDLGGVKEHPFFVRFIQTEERLKYLFELDARLP